MHIIIKVQSLDSENRVTARETLVQRVAAEDKTGGGAHTKKGGWIKNELTTAHKVESLINAIRSRSTDKKEAG
jgi:hypothetical protein